MLTRRRFSAMVAAVLTGGMAACPGVVGASERSADALVGKLVEIEKKLGARLGVAILDLGTGRQWGHRTEELFPLCSTIKVLAAAAVLTRVDAGQDDLDRRIRFGAEDLVTYSPVTKARVGADGMTLAELCEAALTQSDNTAGNLLLDNLGGPAAVNAFARSLGDVTTRLDRRETDLNEAIPGDPRDTTSPAAMVANLRTLVLGDRLSARSRGQLTAWLVANQTGGERLRAGLPKDWHVGDKTGSGGHGTTNDVAVIWPPGGRPPLVVAVYLTETSASAEERNAAIAEVGRALRTGLNF